MLELEKTIRAPFRSGGVKVRDQDGKIVFLEGPERIAKTRGRAEVYLNSLQFGDVGAKIVANELKTNTDCVSLWLYGNDITETGAIELAKGLRTNTTLKVLDLHNNKIGNEGARELARVLKLNSTMLTLNLSGNGVGPKLPQALSKHPTLETLCFEVVPPALLVTHAPWTTSHAQMERTKAAPPAMAFDWDPGSLCGITGVSTMVEPWDRRRMNTLFPGLTAIEGGLSGVSRGDPEFNLDWKNAIPDAGGE